jgi:hypothetical protein
MLWMLAVTTVCLWWWHFLFLSHFTQKNVCLECMGSNFICTGSNFICTGITLFVWEVTLFVREVTLFVREVTLFVREVTLFVREVTLFHIKIISVCEWCDGMNCMEKWQNTDLITLIIFGKEYKFWNIALFKFLKPPLFSFLLDPNIFLSTPFLNTLWLFFSLNVKSWVSHPCRTIEKFSFIYFNLYVLINIWEDKR